MQDTAFTDTELINLLGEGSESAFQEIYRRYWYKLYVVAKRKVSADQDAEEIVQDIFVDLWERRHQERITQLNKFLFGAVKYKVLNYIRAQMVRQEYQQITLRAAVEDDSNTEEALALTDLSHAITAGIAQLPVKTQEIFRLNRLEGLPVKEISAKLNMPERTVEYHITQSLRTMRVCLKDFILSVIIFSFLPIH
jgi:RNA polymerase sigma-70 factor (family 1)